MSKTIKRNLWLLLIAVISLSAVGVAATAVMRRQTVARARSDSWPNQSNPRKGRDYVSRGRLTPRLIRNLTALGDHLEKPGKERLTITGELHSSSDSRAREIVAAWEFPDKLRLGIQNGLQNRQLTFVGQDIKGQATTDELDLIESLTYDSAEHFFNTQMQGNAMRFLGSRFRADDGSNPDYSGPYFDIYKIVDRIDASGEDRAAKLYYFNSETLLLERVTYVINRNGSDVNVETRLGDWHPEGDQKMARRIERLENGKSVFVLNIRSAQFGRRIDDAVFQQ